MMDAGFLASMWTAFGVIVAAGVAANGGVILLFRSQINLLRDKNTAQDKRIDFLTAQGEICEKQNREFREELREAYAQLAETRQQVILLQRTEEARDIKERARRGEK